MMRKMTESVLRARILFFDSNPIGRIVTRFSKDITVIDQVITFSVINMTYGALKLITTVVIVAIMSPWVLIPTFVLFGLILIIMRIGVPALNEGQRLDSVIRGPIHSTFAMIVDGLVSLRAMDKIPYFKEDFKYQVDRGANVTFSYNAVNRWMS